MKSQKVHTDDMFATATVYQSPTITTYTSSELLDLIGPVQAGNSDVAPQDDILGPTEPSGYYSPEEGANERLA